MTAATLYAVQPNIAACQAGTLSQAARDESLRIINEIRALHRLPPVVYSDTDEAEAMAAALIMAANNQLSHTPASSWRCYTDLGSRGAASSNLYGGTSSFGFPFQANDTIFAGWMTEINNLVAENVGHRRWILYPFLTRIAFGRVYGANGSQNSDASAQKVFNFSGSSAVPSGLPAFVAYPYEDYPRRYFASGALFSFGVIANSGGPSGNQNVDYSAATVSVVQRGGPARTVSRVTYDTVGYGLPNNIQFAVDGVQNGVVYDVTIRNVRVNGAARDYSYFFRIT